jgi:hypothetical protein
MTKKNASPVCYAADADDAYMGYAPRDELIAALNTLLEAERAGAKLGLASAKQTPTGKPQLDNGYRAFMLAVRDDEARWCAMLTRHIRQMGGQPSARTGDFYRKAMAIADPLDRLAFLNRGQAWVARALEDLLRRVRDNNLHTDLRAMLDSHHVNIDQTNAFIAAATTAKPAP